MKLFYPDYKNSVMNVTNSILNHYGAPVQYDTISILDKELSKGYNHIIYILLDGMGVNVINHHLNENQALRKYIKKEITSVFPPTTVAATDAVLSGIPPISNGHLGWTQYFKDYDTNLVVFQNFDYYTKEKQPEDLREKYLHFTKIYEQINNVNPNISTNEFFPIFREGGSKSFAEQVEKVLIKTHNTDQSFNYVYWTEPDLSEHVYGVTSKEVSVVLNDLNEQFESLIKNIASDTIVIAIADHGLIDITEIPLNDYPQITNLLIRKPSLEPRAANFFVEAHNHSKFEQLFNKEFGDKFKLYTKEEILASELFGKGPEHPMVRDFIGSFVAVAIDKYMFVFDESSNFIAHHAGLSKEEMIVPLIMYSKTDAK